MFLEKESQLKLDNVLKQHLLNVGGPVQCLGSVGVQHTPQCRIHNPNLLLLLLTDSFVHPCSAISDELDKLPFCAILVYHIWL